MTKRSLTLLFALAVPALAQTTVKNALVTHWKTTGDLTIAVANAMPDSDYGFRPNPEEMSYGQLMVHIAMPDASACALVSGKQAPAMPDKVAAFRKDPKVEIDKATAVQYLTDVFHFCNAAVDSLTPDSLDKVVGPANRQMTGFEWLWSYFTHTAHHRGQAEVYLRVKGIKPPTYTF